MNPFYPNTEGLNSYYDKGRFLLVWRISFVLLAIFVPLTVIYGFIDPHGLVTASTVVGITLISLLYLHKTKNYIPVFWFFTIAGSLLGNIPLYYVNNLTHYVDFVWIISAVLIAFIGLGNRAGFIIIILNCLGLLFFSFSF